MFTPNRAQDSPEAMQKLFDAARSQASPPAWSRGVELARQGAVIGEEIEEDEISLRVSTRGGLICPEVVLFPDDLEWDCSCESKEAVCEHVAAAVIALRRAREMGLELPLGESSGGVIVYRLRRERGALSFERAVVQDGKETPIRTGLAGIARGLVDGPRFAASPADLAVEKSLGTMRSGVVPAALMPPLLEALTQCREVTLDGEPVQTSSDPVSVIAKVSDHGEGFELRIVADPSIDEIFSNKAALCRGVLRPIAKPRLSGRELEELPRGRVYTTEEVAELVTKVLPDLSARVPLEVLSARLPRSEAQAPRIVLDVRRDAHGATVLPVIVYGDPITARIDNGRLTHVRGPVPLRDEAEERRLLRLLEDRFGLHPGLRSQYTGEEAVGLAASLSDLQAEVTGDGLDSFRLEAPLEARIDVCGRRLDIWFESNGVRTEAETVLKAHRDGAALAALPEGGWAPLPTDWLREFGREVADLLAARDAEGRVARSALLDLADFCESQELEIPEEAQLWRRLRQGSFSSETSKAVPEDLQGTLRHYQEEGVAWLALLRTARLGGLLADDMGLGKTLQALCAIRGRTLVIAPTSVLHNWAAEIERFRPTLRTSVFHGPARTIDDDADVILTTYAILRIDADRLTGIHWQSVVLDEAQAIKNPDSKVARAAFRLNAAFKITLTGTPVENRLEELWSQLHFTNRGFLGSRQDFIERYAQPIAEGDESAARRLRRRIGPFVLRRLKRDVAPELPPRTEMELRCELSEAEQRVYDAVRAASRHQVIKKLRQGGSVLAALESLLRLRQASCHPALVPGQRAETSSKLRLLLETLEPIVADGHKALVFSQWTSFLDLIEPHLRRKKIRFTRLDGSTRNRREVVESFQGNGGPDILLISLKAGGTGLNLTAADHVVLLDPWWNPAVEDQAADRAHRIGQTKPVMIYRLVAENTVEERILALQKRKRALAGAALADAAQAAGITRDDLMELLD